MPGSFLDTNIVIYSLSADLDKQDIALSLLAGKPMVSVQVLSETANIMRKKLGYKLPDVRAVIDRIAGECSMVQSLTTSTLQGGLHISERYGFSHYDSLIIASALEAGCSELYSEDMQHGQVISDRLKIINPFR